MKRLFLKLILAACVAAFPAAAGIAGAAEFIIPRAMGPVISRNDMLVQYEYYVDKAGTVQTFAALFDGKNTVRLTPASAQAIARKVGDVAAAGERESAFPYDQGKCLYQTANGQRSLLISPDSGGPVTLVNADIDAFARNFRDALELSTTWVGDALKIEPEIVTRNVPTPAEPASPLRPASPAASAEPQPQARDEADSLLAPVRKWIPASVMPYLDRAENTVRDLYARDKIMTVLSGVLGFLFLLFFFLNRRNKKNAVRIHEYGLLQMRELELQREKELAEASGRVGDMARQLQRIQRGHDDSLVKVKEDYAENAVVFADMIADLVRSRERAPEAVDEIEEALAKKYGGTDAGVALKAARDKSRALARDGRSATCSDGNERYRKAAAAFLTNVFDMRADRALSLVDQGRYQEGMTLLGDSLKEINSYGRALFHTEVVYDYYQAREDELKALRVVRDGNGG